MNAVGVAGRLIPAVIADKLFGSFNTLIPFMAGISVMMFGWIGISDVKGFYAFVVIYGICANAVQTLFPSTLSKLTTDMSKIGIRTGMIFSIISIACLTGPPIAGALIELGGGRFLFAQIFGGITVLLGTSILLLARMVQLRLEVKEMETFAA
jgi:MFS family permease